MQCQFLMATQLTLAMFGDASGGAGDVDLVTAMPLRAWKKNASSVAAAANDDDDDDPTERVLREQTIVMEQATASLDPLSTLTYTVSLLLSGTLVTSFLLPLTDQVLLLLVGTLLVFIVIMFIYHLVLRLALPNAEDERARSDEERKRAYLSMGRWIQNILFMLSFARNVAMFVLVALFLNMLSSLFLRSQPAVTTMLVFVAALNLSLAISFASHPSIGMTSRPTAFLDAGGRN